MDSITQIILGAACGEIVLGRKIGNKALLFGAIGGTIPDLDVFIGRLLYSNEIQVMAFHRGFMHSILFAILACFLFGWITFTLYNSGKRKGTSTLNEWTLLFFLSFITHIVLDSFTPYGTQLFTPFSNYRVAFNNISVVDPIYTLPFLICMIVVLFLKRTNQNRMKWAKAGIYMSSFYLILTLGNKLYINTVFEKSYQKAGIVVDRFSAQPTIFNNFLWYAVAENKNEFLVTFYSLFDEKSISDKILHIPKNHDLLDMKDNDLKTLAWFSKNYYKLSVNEISGTVKYTDLRYPMMNPNDKNSFLFNFTLFQKEDHWDILPFQGSFPNKKVFKAFIQRLKGI
jgi:inner membrane protein